MVGGAPLWIYIRSTVFRVSLRNCFEEEKTTITLPTHTAGLHLGPENAPTARKEDIAPLAGRLVVFFSRTVPHEVAPSKRRDRWALTLWVERVDDPVETNCPATAGGA